jgi:hypothetical protein
MTLNRSMMFCNCNKKNQPRLLVVNKKFRKVHCANSRIIFFKFAHNISFQDNSLSDGISPKCSMKRIRIKK